MNGRRLRGGPAAARLSFPNWRDVALVAALYVADLAFSLNFSEIGAAYGRTAALASVGYAALAYVALLWRHRHPVAVFGIVLAHAVLGSCVDYRPLFAMGAALYAVAASCDVVVARLCLALVSLPAALAVHDETEAPQRSTPLMVGIVTATAYIVTFFVVLRLGERAARARTSIRHLEAQQEAVAREAVDAERRRLARELHDIVSHAVSLIAIQAGAARQVLRHEPERVEEALDLLGSIETQSRDGMAELRRLLNVMRDRGDTLVEEHAQHRLADIAALVPAMEHSGVTVHVTTTGIPAHLHPSVDVTAYRLVQEALTNVAKYAGPGSVATVRIGWGDELVIEVTDSGPAAAPGAPPSAPPSSGTGLIGMRERVRALGGRLEVGPRHPGPGFRVRAVLPVAGRRLVLPGASAPGTHGDT